MSLKKTVAIAAAAGALAAISVPAMALENEFHGMYKMMGFQTNFFNGAAAGLSANPASGFMAEQRARLQYTAKANADLKLVTHFELDSRFGGKDVPAGSGYLGTNKGNDAGNLDADALTLETKNIYLDFNCPITGTNVKAGLQPFYDSYQSLFLMADMTGLTASKKFGAATGTLGWFRFDDNTTTAARVARETADLFVLDGKFAINKDMTVGASYYYANNDANNQQVDAGTELFTSEPHYNKVHVVGVNADLTFGPANIKPFAAYEFGEVVDTTNVKTDLRGLLAGAVAKIKVGPGAVNLSAIYLSGEGENDTDFKSFQPVASAQTYFNASNMWLLVRNGQQINSSTSVLGNDLTVGGHGIVGLFAGYEGTMDKLFYNANVGYAQAAKSWEGEKKALGTEVNAQVGYKLYDNLSASAAVAYMMLGKGLDGNNDQRLHSAYSATSFGAQNADNPYAVNLQLSYTF